MNIESATVATEAEAGVGVRRAACDRAPRPVCRRTAPVIGAVWLVIALLLDGRRAEAQVITDTSNTTLTLTIPFATLAPGTASTPASVQVQFRLRSDSAQGYKVQASATFAATPSSPDGGGATISASDIGVGITAVTARPQVNTPRTDTIASGFDYNPGTLAASNGLTPYRGRLSGHATLADIIASPYLTILSGPTIGKNQSLNGNNYLLVTITFGLLGEFFTPATLSGTLNLTIS